MITVASKEQIQLLREAADDCESEANNLLNQAPNMGRTKEMKYREESNACVQRALALRAWATKMEQVETPAERREYHANGTYWSGVPTIAMPCDFCQQGIEAHDARTHACPVVETPSNTDAGNKI